MRISQFSTLYRALPVLIPVAIYFGFLARYTVNVPYYDDYANILRFFYIYDRLESLPEKLAFFFSQHNEHRLLFNRLVVFVTQALTGSVNFKYLILFGHCAILLSFGVILASYRKHRAFYVIALLGAILLFQPATKVEALWAMVAMSGYYVIFFALLSFYLLARPGRLSFATALLVACLALYTQANGVFALLIGMIWTALRAATDHKNRREQATRALLWWGVTVVILVAYFSDYYTPAGHNSLLDAWQNPLALIRYFLLLAGINLAYGHSAPALGVGILFGMIFLYLTWQRYFITNPVIYAFMGFIVLSIAVVALGRVQLGEGSVFSPRYAILSLFLSVLLALALWDTLPEKYRSWYITALLLIVACAHSYGIYQRALPPVAQHKIRLIRGLNTFILSPTSHSLAYFSHYQDQAKKWLLYGLEKGYYQPGGLLAEFMPKQVKLIQLDPRALPADMPVITRHNGYLDQLSREAERIRLVGWTDIPDQAAGTLVVAVPRLAETITYAAFAREDVMMTLKNPHLRISGFDIELRYADAATADAVDWICIAYTGAGIPLTLLQNSSPVCKQLSGL